MVDQEPYTNYLNLVALAAAISTENAVDDTKEIDTAHHTYVAIRSNYDNKPLTLPTGKWVI